VYDTQCGAKLFRVTPGLESVFQDPFGSRWIFDVELLARLKRQRKQAGLSPVNDAVFEYPLARWQDVGGSKVNAIDGAKAFFDIVKIYWTYLR
jgi:hypothetical protein